MNLVYPKIARRDWKPMIGLALTGGLVGALYGVVNDELTYTLGPEYFTKVKFRQFAWADIGLPPRLLVAEIGFLAAGAVGLSAGWLMARIAVPNSARAVAVRRVAAGFALVLGLGAAGGMAGWLLGRAHDADLSIWQPLLDEYGINDASAFVLVASIHNASYLGALTGLVLALGWLVRQRRADAGNYPGK
jgi:hypothetical protein